MSTGPELSVLYHHHYNTPIIAQHQYRIHNSSYKSPHNHDQMMNQAINYDEHRQQSHFRVVSPPLSVASSSTTSSNNSKLTLPILKSPQIKSRQSYNFTWLVFMNEKWVPFDMINQTKLEQTLTVGGTFVDITDSHFPDVKRVRVFPRSNYLSYLGVKYRLSRIMQPDAYLDHVAVAEAKQPFSSDNRKRIWEM